MKFSVCVLSRHAGNPDDGAYYQTSWRHAHPARLGAGAASDATGSSFVTQV